MAFREITPEPIEYLFEPEGYEQPKQNQTAPQKSKYTLPKVTMPKMSIPHMNLDDKVNLEVVKFLILRGVLVVFLVWFGLTNTGSINGPAYGHFAGDLALVFYQWQFGNLLAMIGVVIGYDTIKRFY